MSQFRPLLTPADKARKPACTGRARAMLASGQDYPRRTQNPAVAIPCEFDSRSRHKDLAQLFHVEPV